MIGQECSRILFWCPGGAFFYFALYTKISSNLLRTAEGISQQLLYVLIRHLSAKSNRITRQRWMKKIEADLFWFISFDVWRKLNLAYKTKFAVNFRRNPNPTKHFHIYTYLNFVSRHLSLLSYLSSSAAARINFAAVLCAAASAFGCCRLSPIVD